MGKAHGFHWVCGLSFYSVLFLSFSYSCLWMRTDIHVSFVPGNAPGSQRWRLSGCGHRFRWKDYCQWHSNPIRCHGQVYMIILINNFFAVALACVVSKQPRSTWFHRWDNISQKDKVVCLNLSWHSLAMSPSRAMFSALPDPQVVDFYGLITRTFFLWFLIPFD